MRRIFTGLPLALVAAGSMTAVPPVQAGEVFDYAVERVELDGNVHGPHDGVADYVDEFDDGVLGSDWAQWFGTVVEEDGALHLRSPGTIVPAGQFQAVPFTLDMSDALSTSTLTIFRDGAGDLTGRVWLRPNTPVLGPDHWVHVTLAANGVAGTRLGGLAFTNFDEGIADLFNPPFASGYAMSLHEEILNGTVYSTGVVSAPVDPNAITGEIVFRFDYDDATKKVAFSYSVDGGDTYLGYANAWSTLFDGSGSGGASLIIGADPYDFAANPPPPTCPRFARGEKYRFTGLGPPLGDERLSARLVVVETTGADPSVEGWRVTLTDTPTGAPVVDVTLPAGAVGSGCGPSDGWTVRGGRTRSYRYRNATNALPPSCVAGSAGGVQAASLHSLGANNVQRLVLKLKGASIPGVTGPLGATVVRESVATGCNSFQTTADLPCRTSAHTAACR